MYSQFLFNNKIFIPLINNHQSHPYYPNQDKKSQAKNHLKKVFQEYLNPNLIYSKIFNTNKNIALSLTLNIINIVNPKELFLILTFNK